MRVEISVASSTSYMETERIPLVELVFIYDTIAAINEAQKPKTKTK